MKKSYAAVGVRTCDRFVKRPPKSHETIPLMVGADIFLDYLHKVGKTLFSQ
jgi:hypothetical protein